MRRSATRSNRNIRATADTVNELSPQLQNDAEVEDSITQLSALWGRAWTVDWAAYLGCLFVITVCPFLPAIFAISCPEHDCSIAKTLSATLFKANVTPLTKIVTTVSKETLLLYVMWIAVQVILAIIPDFLHFVIPRYRGGIQEGAVTPAGNVNYYIINGLQAWIVVHTLWLFNAFYFKYFSPAFISRNIPAFLVYANVFGYTLAVLVFLKGRLFPTSKDDRKFSGNVLYDFIMGIEFNPRLGKFFDFKLFFNGRPGIVCWTLINSSYAWHQREKFGYISDSMILLNLLQALYVFDFFWNETWYLKTIDISHDHFGFYLAWGDLVWLPFMYTLQGRYLVYHPVRLGTWRFIAILTLGVVGYVIFRTANFQKDRFRVNPEETIIWGKKATFIPCKFVSGDGQPHKSALLTSGWWGIGRHMNYTGDLLGSLAYCLCCGADHYFPYFYITFMFILLVHRIYRDEHRCAAKYGKYWKQYTKTVPYRLMPGVY